VFSNVVSIVRLTQVSAVSVSTTLYALIPIPVSIPGELLSSFTEYSWSGAKTQLLVKQ